MDRIHKIVWVFAAFGAAILPTGRREAQARDVIDLKAHLAPYRQTLALAVDMLGMGVTYIPFQVVTADGVPAGQTSVRFIGRTSQLPYTTDGDGRATLRYQEDMLDFLQMEVPAGSLVKFEVTPEVIVTARAGAGTSGRGPGYSGWEAIHGSGTVVVFRAGDDSAARNAAGLLDRIREFIDGFTGRSMPLLSPFRLLLLPSGQVSAPSDFPVAESFALPLSASDFAPRKSGYDDLIPLVVAHEWTEASIVFPSLYDDRRMRVVGDGLAEWLSFEYARRFHPAAAARRLRSDIAVCRDLLRQGLVEYDLADFSAVQQNPVPLPGDTAAAISSRELAGYAVSFWIWWKFSQKSGPEAVGRFLAWLKTSPRRRLEDVSAVLSQTAGFAIATRWPLARVAEDIEAIVRFLESGGSQDTSRVLAFRPINH